jgi:hypothetical protein
MQNRGKTSMQKLQEGGQAPQFQPLQPACRAVLLPLAALQTSHTLTAVTASMMPSSGMDRGSR